MASGPQCAIEVTTDFFPLAFLLFFCTPTIEIDGTPHPRSWGRQSFPVSAGVHTVRIYFRYLFLAEAGANSMDVDVAAGTVSRIRFHMPPWMFARGRIEELEPVAAASSGEATKRCPRCAEDVRLEAVVCPHCNQEFDRASIEAALARHEAQQAAARERIAERRESREQVRLFHRHRRALAWARVCFVAGGLAFVVAFAQFIVASTGADATGPAEPLPMALGYTFLAGLLLVGGVSQRRRSRRSHEALLTRVAAGRDRYHCRCGKPKYPYFWLHGLLCIVFPYGLLALLFPLKKCRGCGVEYDAAGEAG